MSKEKFLKDYFQKLGSLLKFSDNDLKNLILTSEFMLDAHKNKKL